MSKPLFRAYFRSTSGVFGSDHPQYHPDAERFPSAKEGHAAYVEQERKALAAILRPRGNKRRTVHTILRNVSASGMSRRISLVIVDKGELRDITYQARVVLGEPLSDKEGITVAGAGMDMGFALVYRLGSALWPTGTSRPHSHRNGKPDRCGGYALNQRWL